MRLVVIIGAPAVGKATVGKALAEACGFRLFHNHVSLDAVASVFDWGTPPFGRLVGEFRRRVVEEAVSSEVDLVFTYVWAFSEPDDGAPIRRYRETVLRAGGTVYFVELIASQVARFERNGMASRRAMKARSDEASTPAWLREIDAKYSFESGGSLPFPDPYLRLDTTEVEPEAAAEAIAHAFGFERAARP
jgi:hypothetical protein